MITLEDPQCIVDKYPDPLSGNAGILGTFEPPSAPLYSDTKILIQTPTGLQGEHMLRSSSQTQMYVGKISQIASTATKETGVYDHWSMCAIASVQSSHSVVTNNQ